jgi:hypothetical protein
LGLISVVSKLGPDYVDGLCGLGLISVVIKLGCDYVDWVYVDWD